jgi:hypothetical protein
MISAVPRRHKWAVPLVLVEATTKLDEGLTIREGGDFCEYLNGHNDMGKEDD